MRKFGQEKGRKVFFFEKKKQKTFALLLSTCMEVGSLTRPPKSKSFLVLFFKKEDSSFV